MQPLLDGPRAHLTEAAVKGLLQSHSSIQVTYGATALDNGFGEVGDISGYLSEGSSITSSMDSTVHRVCALNIDSDVISTGWSYLSGFIRPYMTLTDMATGVNATFHLGVYTLTTAPRSLGSAPATLALAGYDLKYLLRQAVGDSYEVPAGSDPALAAAEVISLAIPEVTVVTSPSGSTMDTQLSWPFDASQPTTYLDIIEKLLTSIGYRQVWVDWDGKFRIEPFIDLQQEQFEWTFNLADDDNIVVEERTQNVDLYTVPNWFRFVMADLADLPAEGVTQFTYQDDSPANPGSTVNRRHLVRHIESITSTSYDDLVDYAQRTIAALLKPGETFDVQTQPFPLAWHMDVIQYLDEALKVALPVSAGGERRVVSTTWTLPLDGESDMTWTWQTITDQSAALGIATEESQ